MVEFIDRERATEGIEEAEEEGREPENKCSI